MKQLLLGVAQEIITPKIGGNLYGYAPDVYSESVHDDLTLTVFAFTCGDLKAMMISACVGSIGTDVSDSLRQELGKMFEMDANNIIISATHTHSGPNLNTDNNSGWGQFDQQYFDSIFHPALLKTAKNAFSHSEPVRLAIATGESKVGINRRELLIENNLSCLGQNPQGCFNPKMILLSFQNLSGKVTGNMIVYGCHGTCAGRNHEITRDWSGIMVDALTEHTGGITAFFNGPEGDVGPRLSNGKTTGDITYVEELGAIAANDVLRIYQTISEFKDATVSTSYRALKLPLLPRIPYETAVELYEKSDKNSYNITKFISEYYRKVKESYEQGYEEQPYMELPQSIIRIGSVAFVAFPYELFSEIGMRIDRAVPDLQVLSLAISNGKGGYFPTQDQLCRGGYEINYFKHKQIQCHPDDADYQLIKETLANLETLARE
ncbi:MAG: hypothetical protein E7399_09150 [Ruminococcaceae bacterium]|nr:hypothetical protein [Oscillospiraceae bacterium]